jgi:hypothetical protein
MNKEVNERKIQTKSSFLITRFYFSNDGREKLCRYKVDIPFRLIKIVLRDSKFCIWSF